MRSNICMMAMLSMSACLQAQTGFVTLQGRQFLIDGQPFYPNALNYGVQISTTTANSSDPSHHFVTPEGAFDRDLHNAFECSSLTLCNAQLQAHFAKVVSMGFNTIRLVGLGPRMKRSISNDYTYSFTVYNNPLYSGEYDLELNMPDYDNTISNGYFDLILNALTQADIAGLKVILLCGGGIGKGAGQPSSGELQYIGDDAEQYSYYLQALAAKLKDHPALMAYDLWNEPIWAGNGATNLTKSEVCDFTSLWYDAIKSEDQNHLVTLNGYSVSELNSWDPSVMKIDFYSPHIYPAPYFFDGYDMSNTYARAVDEIYWLGADCTMAWMIGETAFSAEDDFHDNLNDPLWNNLDSDPAHHEMPWMHGNETEQKDFAETTMDATRNYLGSGYSWWAFQNFRSNPISDPGTSPGEYRGSFYAPLKYGDGTTSWFDKEMVAMLQTYSPPSAPSSLPVAPSSYFNWAAFPLNSYREYVIEDQNDLPIENAIAEVGWKYRWSLNDPDLDEVVWDHVPSDEEGDLVILEAPDNIFGYDDPMAGGLSIWASGAEGPNWSAMAWPSTANPIPLYRERMFFSDEVEGLTVALASPPQDFKAWSELEVSNTVVEGDGTNGPEVDFHARDWVHTSSEFHAQKGSEVHLFTGETWADCSHGAYHTMVAGSIHPEPYVEQKGAVKSVALQFTPQRPELAVFPNPCKERITLQTNAIGTCSVYDMNGRLVYTSSMTSNTLIISTVDLLPGEYVVRFESEIGTEQTSFTKLP